VGLKAERWQSRGSRTGKTPECSVSAGGITKEEQGVIPRGMLGDSGVGCRTVAIQYTTLESEYYFRIAAASMPSGVMQQLLDCEGSHQCAFHWGDDPVLPRLLIHRQHRQDALRHSWDGLVSGTDSVDERTEVMAAGYVLGADPQPTISFFARVGGPLAGSCGGCYFAPALRDARQRYSNRVHLLIFVDCLILDIIRKWGRSYFHPSPKEIVRFAVIYPLLKNCASAPSG
jgi:hypothetical protein